MMHDLDWNDLKVLLAVSETGSLSAAASHLRTSQPTLGRRVDALESTLGIRIFDRSPRGLSLTPAGTDLLCHAREMEASAARLSLAAAGRSEAVSGTVRLTAPMVISHFHLPTILTALLNTEPGVEIELVPSDDAQNLLLREADIAIRTFRPREGTLIARKITELPLGLYASDAYIDHHGLPTVDTFRAHRVVGYDRNPMIRNVMQSLGFDTSQTHFPARTDDQAAYWHLVVAGAGIGGNQRSVGDATPGVQRVLPEIDLPTLPVWLTCHADLHTNKLIRIVFDFLAGALGRIGKENQK